MTLDVRNRLAQEIRIVLQSADPDVASGTQKVANATGDVVVIDVQRALTGWPAADRAPAVLSGELRAIDLEGHAVEALPERVAFTLACPADTTSRMSSDIPIRIRFIERMAALAMRLVLSPVFFHSALRSCLSAASKCFFNSLDVIRVYRRVVCGLA